MFFFFSVYMFACLSISFSLHLYPLSLFISFGMYSSFSGCHSLFSFSLYLFFSICLSLFAYFSICPCLYVYFCLSISVFFYLPASVSRCLSVHLSLSLQLPSSLLHFFAVQSFRFLNL